MNNLNSFVFLLAAFCAVSPANAVQTIQHRVDSCAAAGGGRVVVAPGTWKTGPIHLRSNVELHLE
jgi:polygalacturonase